MNHSPKFTEPLAASALYRNSGTKLPWQLTAAICLLWCAISIAAADPSPGNCVSTSLTPPSNVTAWGQTPFSILPASKLLQNATSYPRPRSFPSGEEWTTIRAALTTERAAGLESLLRKVRINMREPLPNEPPLILQNNVDYQTWAKHGLSTMAVLVQESRKIEEAAFAWKVTRDASYLAEAKRRTLWLAGWDPRGGTGYASYDLAAREAAWPLALAFDWLYNELSPAERNKLLAAIVPRVDDTVASLLGGPSSLVANPFNSHGIGVVGVVADIGVVLAGETGRAGYWMANILPLYASLVSPWGGDDGGYANGTSYALWEMGVHLKHWDTLKRVTRVDLGSKPWVRNFGRFLTYFLPPGAPVGAFGDGSEVPLRGNMRADWARFGKQYAGRVNDPLYRWYGRQLFGEDPSRLDVLLAPPLPTTPQPFPESTRHSAVFPSIGWAAFHSDLQDRGRISLYFKSSPYGSQNHGHADQNAFTVYAGGEELAINSGYYDWYGSPHHMAWSRQSLAHNTVTFDGGQGQSIGAKGATGGDPAATGSLTEFVECGDLDYVTGDATQAYVGKVSKAVRSIAYLRPDTIVVFDRLESRQARRWEWNIHAHQPIKQISSTEIELNSRNANACVDFYSDIPVAFTQTRSFPVNPDRTSTSPRPDQSHGRFSGKAASVTATFAAVIRVGCHANTAEVSLPSSGQDMTVRLAGKTLVFDGTRLHQQ